MGHLSRSMPGIQYNAYVNKDQRGIKKQEIIREREKGRREREKMQGSLLLYFIQKLKPRLHQKHKLPSPKNSNRHIDEQNTPPREVPVICDFFPHGNSILSRREDRR